VHARGELRPMIRVVFVHALGFPALVCASVLLGDIDAPFGVVVLAACEFLAVSAMASMFFLPNWRRDDRS